MSDNPYDAPGEGRVVESASSTTQEILDATTGEQGPISGASTIVQADLGSGARVFIERHVRVRSLDGRLLDPAEQVYRCLCGCKAHPISRHAVRFCEFCQNPILHQHAKTWDDGLSAAIVCPPCWHPGRYQRALLRFLRWLTRL